MIPTFCVPLSALIIEKLCIAHQNKFTISYLISITILSSFINGFITNVKWYLNLSRIQLKRFLRELLDIWQYRAQISNEIKRKINPQHGDPFFTINMAVLMHKCFEVLQIF